MADQHTIALTIDVEADGGGFPDLGRAFDSFKQLPRLLSTLRERQIPTTGFVEGEILDNRPELIEPLIEFGAELECHAYDHNSVGGCAEDRIRNMERGLEAYDRFFGATPKGFRSPQGIIEDPDLERLAENGVEYDASVFPCYFPGRFNNLSSPVTPFRHPCGLVELPFGALGRIRYPLGLSFAQLIGSRAFLLLFERSRKPETFVFNLHLHDLWRGAWHLQKGLPLSMRYGYKATLRRDPYATFERFLDHAQAGGCRFTTMRRWLSALNRESVDCYP